MTREALEQEPCEDAISRQAVIDGINKYFHDEYYQRTSIQDCRDCLIEDVIKSLPSITPPPKTGHWIYSKAVNTGEIVFSECSVCGHGESRCAKRMNYCPICGARMIESENKS